VVGINTAILSPSGGSVGIGFAIPANTVKTVVADLEKNGHVTRGYIGVEAQPVSDAMAKALRLSGDKGALIAGVAPDGPAAKAGLQPGDVINAVNGQQVANARQLAVSIAGVKPGEEAKLGVIRDGEAKTVTAVVSEQPGDTQVANARDAQDEGRGRIGVALAPISPAARDPLSLPEGTKGAVVAQVRPGSAAEQAGVRPGDVIVGVGSKSVSSPDDAVQAIRNAISSKQEAVALRILREGQPAYIAVTPNGADQSQG
jgi:serine protease Do